MYAEFDYADSTKDTVKIYFFGGIKTWDYWSGQEDLLSLYYDDPMAEPIIVEASRLEEEKNWLIEEAREAFRNEIEWLQETCREEEYESICKPYKDIIYADRETIEKLTQKLAEEVVGELIEYIKNNN